MRQACFTVDVEPDCPPYLWTWRGVDEAMPALLDLLDAESVPTTFFVTGDAARRSPTMVESLVARGHELACHGMTHTAFDTMSPDAAEGQIVESARLLRTFAPVSSFRAPYLRLPESMLPLLQAHGFDLDSSRGKYKPAHWSAPTETTLRRVPASVTSSWLRLPRAIRDPVLARLDAPAVLFVHPWEFVNLQGTPIPWDCRAGTGPSVYGKVASAIGLLRARGMEFTTMRDLVRREGA